MTTARHRQLCLHLTPFYHCVTRCVRRAWLCGDDALTGRNFDHRRDWIEKHLLLLGKAFCIDVAGYAIMSNHYHVVLHVNTRRAAELTDAQIIERWYLLYKGPEIVRRYAIGENLEAGEHDKVKKILEQWRAELTAISRFMGHLNERIARRANKEDGCKGRFWESRFKLQALLDYKSIIRMLCYVDLNPVRAKMAATPEACCYTSVKRRLDVEETGLMPFARTAVTASAASETVEAFIPISLDEYLKLLDYTGRAVHKGKSGSIDDQLPGILTRLGYSDSSWKRIQSGKPRWRSRALGSSALVSSFCEWLGQGWIWETE